jgi:hypothetical protein
MERVPGFVGRRIGALELAGKRNPVEAWEALHPEEAGTERLRAYEEAFEQMTSGDAEALDAFRALERERPDDALVRLHRQRLEAGERGAVLTLSTVAALGAPGAAQESPAAR